MTVSGRTREIRRGLINLDTKLEAEIVWEKVLEKLKPKIIKPIFDIWMKPTFALNLTDEDIEIGTHKRFVKDWIESRYTSEIESALYHITKKTLGVIIIFTEENEDSLDKINKTFKYYMSLPYKIVLYPAKEGGYTAEIPELPGCLTQANNEQDALKMIEDAKATWIDIALQDGKAIPGHMEIELKLNEAEIQSRAGKAILFQQATDELRTRVSFGVKEVYDEELKGWTISVAEIDLYGEGASKEEAVSDLIASINEYISLYSESDFLAKHESPEKQAAIIKLMRCKSDEAIRKALGIKLGKIL